MRCKRNDLAVIVAPYFCGAIGYVVRVVRPARDWEYLGGRGYLKAADCGEGWVVEGRIPCAAGGMRSSAAIADDCLRPLRDPGDDAVDETLSWLPVPSKDIQHAMDDLRAHIAQGAREKAGAA